MLVLTEGWDCAGRPGIVAGVGVRRRGVGRRSRRGRYGVLRTPGLHGSMHGVPTSMPRGSGGSGIAGGNEITAAQEPSPSGGPAQFRRRKGLGPVQGLQGACWSYGEASVGLPGANRQWFSVSTAAQRALHGGAMRRRQLGFVRWL